MSVENRTGLGRTGREEGREGEKEEGEEREEGRRADKEDPHHQAVILCLSWQGLRGMLSVVGGLGWGCFS